MRARRVGKVASRWHTDFPLAALFLACDAGLPTARQRPLDSSTVWATAKCRLPHPTITLIASGLVGEPTAPVIGDRGGHEHELVGPLSSRQSSASLGDLEDLPPHGDAHDRDGDPVATAWLMPSSDSLGRTSQPQVSLANGGDLGSCGFHSSVSNEKPGASPPG